MDLFALTVKPQETQEFARKRRQTSNHRQEFKREREGKDVDHPLTRFIEGTLLHKKMNLPLSFLQLLPGFGNLSG